MAHKSMRTKEELSELARLRARVLELEQALAIAPSGASRLDDHVSDDTDRAETEQERDRLVAILETTSDLVATAHSTTQLSYMNEAGRRLLGWSANESLQTKTLADMYPAWAAKIVVETGVPAAVQFGAWQGETAIIGADGTEIPVSQVILAHRSQDGELRYHSTIIRDIRERTRAEEDLRASERRYRAVVEDQTEFIVRWLPDGIRTFVNEAYCRFFEQTYDQLVGTSFFPLVPKEQHQAILEMLGRLTPDAPVITEEHQAIKPGGELCWQQWTSRAEFDSRNQIVELLSVGRDITDRVQAEREKAQLQDQLHQAQKMEAVGQLAAGVAHDFNNILTVISAYTDLIHSKCSSEGNLADWVGTIQRAVQQATGVTRSLLTFSHKVTAHKEPVDLCAVTTEAVHMLERALPASIELVTDTSCTPAPWVNADATQLHQVILNLAINARDAMPHGGTLNIAVLPPACDEPTSAIPQGCSTPTARLVMRDTGVGMSPDVQSRIFEPFFTTKKRGHGTGLGLAMIHGIVREHGGWIDVQTKPQEGSTFTIHLPCIDSTKAEMQVHADVDNIHGGGELIILAEDREEVREVVATALTSVGYEVLQAGDGESFLGLVRSRRDDVRLCVLDVDLPQKTGTECLSAIRADGVNEPVIMMTGNPDILESIKIDPDVKLLLKPFRMAELQRLAGRLIADTNRTPQ